MLSEAKDLAIAKDLMSDCNKILHYVQNDIVGFFGPRFFGRTDKGM
ncbi:MAG: hypothetical protein ACOX42_00180 [Clostridia bacterium]|jgi:hypothetical protein